MRYVVLITVLALIAAAGALGFFFYESYVGAPGEEVVITVEQGDVAADVALRLEQADVVADASRYLLYGRLDESIGSAKAGTYRVKKGDSFRRIARQFALGPVRSEVTVRVIEGETLDEIAESLSADFGIAHDQTFASAGRSLNAQSFDPLLRQEYAFLAGLGQTRSLEGYLFPDTYQVWEDELPEGLIYKQLNEFNRRFGRTEVGSSAAPLRSLDEVVILASIVEAEVATAADRKIVAGIFLNRLQSGMRLQSDATVNYITSSGRSRSTVADLAIDSPYNTYRYGGLPPSPIGNPGAQAIEAVLFPTVTDYHYFLTTDDGETLFARTFDEHQQNRARAGF